jgi:hypothetical protein
VIPVKPIQPTNQARICTILSEHISIVKANEAKCVLDIDMHGYRLTPPNYSQTPIMLGGLYLMSNGVCLQNTMLT